MVRLFLVLLLSFAFSSYAKTPISAGFIENHQSKVLGEKRRFMVDLPENYYENEQSYPTLYVIDADFQFHHVSAVTKNLARMGKIPPMIVIGIANQGNADYLYQTTWIVEGEEGFGGADNFYRYISDELVPTVDKQFRTNENRVLAGYSLGGLFTTYAMIQENTPFNAFLAMSPSYWFDDYSAVESISKYVEQKGAKGSLPPLFLSVANEQGMGVAKLDKSLQKLAIKDWQYSFKTYPNENHFSTALPAFHDALGFLFTDFYEDGYEMLEHKNVFDLIEVFKAKKANYNGFNIEWLQAYKFAKYVFHSKQTDKIDEILAAMNKHFPDSMVNVTSYLAKGFNVKEQHETAKRILEAVRSEGKNIALWHHQYSLALAGLGQTELAEKSQAKAMVLAKEHKLPMWQVWEMK